MLGGHWEPYATAPGGRPDPGDWLAVFYKGPDPHSHIAATTYSPPITTTIPVYSLVCVCWLTSYRPARVHDQRVHVHTCTTNNIKTCGVYNRGDNYWIRSHKIIHLYNVFVSI